MPNVFLIGRPGCGKSVVFKIIEEQLRARGFKGELKRIDDFPLLKHIFGTDVEHKRHRPAPGGGLKVTDGTVWDDLAKGLNKQAIELQDPNRLLFIEFSRDSYIRAFKNFSPKLLKNSLVVYVDCPFDICWQRNVRRTRSEKGLDAHLVSREEMEKTYARDDHGDLPKHISAPVLVVKNDFDDLGRLREELRTAVEKIEEMVKNTLK